MSTYLSRPIFPLTIDWNENPARSFNYNLRELQIGFGALSAAPLQQEIVHGLAFSLTLQTADIIALDAFTTLLQHGLAGFWLPAESEAMTMTSNLVSGVFDIKAQNLAATWQELPALYVWFEPEGAAAFAAKVSGVATVNANTERVTLDNLALNCAGCAVRRLLYVRFTGDAEEAEFDTEGYAVRKIRVVELPLEYAAVETGTRPVFLFDFAFEFAGSVRHWRYTSFLDPVTIGAVTYAPYPITYKSLRHSTRIDQTSCTVVTVMDAAGPFELYASGAAELPLAVTISKTTLPGLATPAVIFAGQVTDVRLTGRQIEASISNFVVAFSRRLPRLTVQPRCQWMLWDPATCALSKVNYAKAAVVLSTADGKDMTVIASGLGSSMTGWFAFGTLQFGSGEHSQLRRILYDSSTDADRRRIILDHPLDNPVGASVTLLPGCDRSWTTCASKFNNFHNFGGHPFVPARNLSMNITTDSQGGAKK